MSVVDHFNIYRRILDDVLERVDTASLTLAHTMLIATIEKKMPTLVMGNGGSAAISDHLACDHGKGITYDTKFSNYVISLPSNVALLTAIANDIGYDSVFSFQINQMNFQDATVVGISASGSSPNVVNGFKAARQKQYKTIAMVGFDGGTVLKENLADCIIHVPSSNYGIVEDAHQIIMHTLSQTIRKNFCTGPIKL